MAWTSVERAYMNYEKKKMREDPVYRARVIAPYTRQEFEANLDDIISENLAKQSSQQTTNTQAVSAQRNAGSDISDRYKNAYLGENQTYAQGPITEKQDTAVPQVQGVQLYGPVQEETPAPHRQVTDGASSVQPVAGGSYQVPQAVTDRENERKAALAAAGWTREKEDRLVELRNDLSRYRTVPASQMATNEDTKDAYAEYMQLRSEVPEEGGYSGALWAPENPKKEKIYDLLNKGLVGVAGGAEGVLNFVTDTANQFTPSMSIAKNPTEADVELARSNPLRTTAISGKANELLVNPNDVQGKVWDVADEVSTSIGNMTPSIVANVATGGAAGLSVLFASAAGNATTEALNQGATQDQAYTYGILSGGIEVATEKMFGGIPGMGNGVLSEGVEAAIEKGIKKLAVDNTGKWLIQKAVDILGEGIEEWVSEAAGQYLVRIYDEAAREESISETWKNGQAERIRAGLMGALTSLVMNVPTARSDFQNYQAEIAQGNAANAAEQASLNEVTAEQFANPITEYAEPPIATPTSLAVPYSNEQLITDLVNGVYSQMGAQAAQDTSLAKRAEDYVVEQMTGRPVNADAAIAENEKIAQGYGLTVDELNEARTQFAKTGLPGGAVNFKNWIEDEFKPGLSNAQSVKSSYISADVTGKSPEDAARVNDYLNAVDEKAVKDIESLSLGDAANASIGHIEKSAADRIHAEIGFSPENYEIVLPASEYAHIKRNHGETGRRDHSMSDIYDMARANYILNNFDRVYKGDRNPRYNNAESLILSKRIDGTFYAVEVVPEGGKNRAYITSMFISRDGDSYGKIKKIIEASNQRPDVKSPGSTSKNVAESKTSISDTSIPKSTPGVNTQDMRQSGDISESANMQTDERNPLELKEVKEVLNDVRDGNAAMVEKPFEENDVGMAQALGNKVNYNSIVDRILDNVAGKSKEVRAWLKVRIEDPLFAAKAECSKQIESHIREVKADIVDALGIKAKSKESAAIMWFGEGQKIQSVSKDGKVDYAPYSLNDLKKDFPGSWEKIVRAEKIVRQIYDDYVVRLNDSLQKVYPDVEKQADVKLASMQLTQDSLRTQRAQMESEHSNGNTAYTQETLDFVDEQIAKLGGEIETLRKRIASGEEFRNKRLYARKDYFHHFMEMEQGFEGLQNIINKPSDIDPKLAGLSEFTKPKSKWQSFMQQRKGGEYVEDAIGGLQQYIKKAEYSININPVIAEYRGLIKELATATSQTRNANKFIEWFTDYTNDLAGKTGWLDRALLQKPIGRKVVQVANWINGRVKSNKILGNFNSALAQLYNIPNATLYIPNPVSWAKGMKDYAKSWFKTSESRALLAQSDFLRERYLDNTIAELDVHTLKDTPRRFAEWMMEFGDKEASKLIWLSAYEDGVAKNVDSPAKYADTLTRKSVGGRGIGELPLVQKQQVVKLFAPFQVEVSNAWDAVVENVKKGNVAGLANFLVTSYIMNALAKAVRGSGVSMDFLGAIIEEIKSWDDDDDEEEMTATQKAIGMAQRLAGEAVNNMPFGSLGTSLLIGSDLGEAFFGTENDPTRFGTGNVGISAIAKPAGEVISAWSKGETPDWGGIATDAVTDLVLPGGGAQVKRTLEAAESMWGNPLEDRAPGSYTDRGKYRFGIDTSNPLNVAQGLLFGQYATKEGRAYIDGGAKPMSDAQTEKLQAAFRNEVEAELAVRFAKQTTRMGQSDVGTYIYDEFKDNLSTDEMADLWSSSGSNWKEEKNPFTMAQESDVALDAFMEVYKEYQTGQKQTQDALLDIILESSIPDDKKDDVWEAYMKAEDWKKTYEEAMKSNQK